MPHQKNVQFCKKFVLLKDILIILLPYIFLTEECDVNVKNKFVFLFHSLIKCRKPNIHRTSVSSFIWPLVLKYIVSLFLTYTVVHILKTNTEL